MYIYMYYYSQAVLIMGIIISILFNNNAHACTCSLILHMMGEACLKEDTLMRVLVIGLARELPLSSTDAMDIADVLVARAANAHTEGMRVYM